MLLENIETATNAEDAALIQSLKTLDSIESKTTQFQTALQQFYTSTGIEDAIKGLIDLGTNVLNIFNSLNIGEVGVVIIQLSSFIKNILLNMIASIQADLQRRKQQLEEGAKEAGTNAANNFVSSWQQVVNKAKDTLTDLGTPGKKLNAFSGVLKSLGPIVTILSSVIDLGKRTSGVFIGIGTAITGVGTALSYVGKKVATSNWIFAIAQIAYGLFTIIDSAIETTEEKIERLDGEIEEARNAATLKKNEVKTLTDERKKLEEATKARYDSKESYEEWLSIQADIVDKYPELLAGYDAEGNALAEITGLTYARAKAVEEYNKKLMERLGLEKQLADTEVEQAEDDKEEAENNLNFLEESVNSINTVLTSYGNVVWEGKDGNIYFGNTDTMPNGAISDDNGENITSFYELLNTASQLKEIEQVPDFIKAFEAFKNDTENASDLIIGNGYSLLEDVASRLNVDADIIETMRKEVEKEGLKNVDLNPLYTAINDRVTTLNDNIAVATKEVENSNNAIKKTLISQKSSSYRESSEGEQYDAILSQMPNVYSTIVEGYVSRQLESLGDDVDYNSTATQTEAGLIINSSLGDITKTIWKYIENATTEEKEKFNALLGNLEEYSSVDLFKELKDMPDDLQEEIRKSFIKTRVSYMTLFDNFAISMEEAFKDDENGLNLDVKTLKRLRRLPVSMLQGVQDTILIYKKQFENTDDTLIKQSAINAANEFINTMLQVSFLDHDDKSIAEAIINQGDKTSLTGINEIIQKLSAPEYNDVFSEVITQLQKLANTIIPNFSLEWANYLDGAITSSENVSKILDKAKKGMDQTEAYELSKQLGVTIDKFRVNDGKFYYDNLQDIVDLFAEDSKTTFDFINEKTNAALTELDSYNGLTDAQMIDRGIKQNALLKNLYNTYKSLSDNEKNGMTFYEYAQKELTAMQESAKAIDNVNKYAVNSLYLSYGYLDNFIESLKGEGKNLEPDKLKNAIKGKDLNYINDNGISEYAFQLFDLYENITNSLINDVASNVGKTSSNTLIKIDKSFGEDYKTLLNDTVQQINGEFYLVLDGTYEQAENIAATLGKGTKEGNDALAKINEAKFKASVDGVIQKLYDDTTKITEQEIAELASLLGKSREDIIAYFTSNGDGTFSLAKTGNAVIKDFLDKANLTLNDISKAIISDSRLANFKNLQSLYSSAEKGTLTDTQLKIMKNLIAQLNLDIDLDGLYVKTSTGIKLLTEGRAKLGAVLNDDAANFKALGDAYSNAFSEIESASSGFSVEQAMALARKIGIDFRNLDRFEEKYFLKRAEDRVAIYEYEKQQIERNKQQVLESIENATVGDAKEYFDSIGEDVPRLDFLILFMYKRRMMALAEKSATAAQEILDEQNQNLALQMFDLENGLGENSSGKSASLYEKEIYQAALSGIDTLRVVLNKLGFDVTEKQLKTIVDSVGDVQSRITDAFFNSKVGANYKINISKIVEHTPFEKFEQLQKEYENTWAGFTQMLNDEYAGQAIKSLEEFNKHFFEGFDFYKSEDAKTQDAAAMLINNYQSYSSDLLEKIANGLGKTGDQFLQDVLTRSLDGNYRIDSSQINQVIIDAIAEADGNRNELIALYADLLRANILSVTDHFKNALNGTMQNSDKIEFLNLLKESGVDVEGLDLKFTEFGEGLKISQESAEQLYTKLKEVKPLAAQIVLNELINGAKETDETLKNIFKVSEKINDLNKELATTTDQERINHLNTELDLHKKILKELEQESDTYNFMKNPMPSGYDNPISAWMGIGQAFDVLKGDEFVKKGRMTIEDFSAIMEFAGEGIASSISEVNGKTVQAADLLVAGFQHLVYANGKLNIDMKAFGADFGISAEEMEKGLMDGIHDLASSQIKMIDAQIDMLKAIKKTQEAWDSIDLDKNGQLSLGEWFKADAEFQQAYIKIHGSEEVKLTFVDPTTGEVTEVSTTIDKMESVIEGEILSGREASEDQIIGIFDNLGELNLSDPTFGSTEIEGVTGDGRVIKIGADKITFEGEQLSEKEIRGQVEEAAKDLQNNANSAAQDAIEGANKGQGEEAGAEVELPLTLNPTKVVLSATSIDEEGNVTITEGPSGASFTIQTAKGTTQDLVLTDVTGTPTFDPNKTIQGVTITKAGATVTNLELKNAASKQYLPGQSELDEKGNFVVEIEDEATGEVKKITLDGAKVKEYVEEGNVGIDLTEAIVSATTTTGDLLITGYNTAKYDPNTEGEEDAGTVTVEAINAVTGETETFTITGSTYRKLQDGNIELTETINEAEGTVAKFTANPLSYYLNLKKAFYLPIGTIEGSAVIAKITPKLYKDSDPSKAKIDYTDGINGTAPSATITVGEYYISFLDEDGKVVEDDLEATGKAMLMAIFCPDSDVKLKQEDGKTTITDEITGDATVTAGLAAGTGINDNNGTFTPNVEGSTVNVTANATPGVGLFANSDGSLGAKLGTLAANVDLSVNVDADTTIADSILEAFEDKERVIKYSVEIIGQEKNLEETEEEEKREIQKPESISKELRDNIAIGIGERPTVSNELTTFNTELTNEDLIQLAKFKEYAESLEDIEILSAEDVILWEKLSEIFAAEKNIDDDNKLETKLNDILASLADGKDDLSSTTEELSTITNLDFSDQVSELESLTGQGQLLFALTFSNFDIMKSALSESATYAATIHDMLNPLSGKTFTVLMGSNNESSPILPNYNFETNGIGGVISAVETKMSNLKTALDGITDKSDAVQNTADAISALESKEITITVKGEASIEGSMSARVALTLPNGAYGQVYGSVGVNSGSPKNFSTTIGSSSGTSIAAKAGGNALASGNTRTLMGELGPEMVVSNGSYYLVGENGAEFVNLADDAIVFNHLQTQQLLKNGRSSHGRPITNEHKATSMATGNVHGPAKASVDQAIDKLVKVRAIWEGLLNLTADDLGKKAGGGGGGDNDYSGLAHDLQRWYNLLRQIANEEQKITYEEEKRKNMLSGYDYSGSLQKELDILRQQEQAYRTLSDLQEKWYRQRVEDLNKSDYSKIFTSNAEGLIQYLDDPETHELIRNRGLDILAKMNETNKNGALKMNAKQQLDYLEKTVGFDVASLFINADGSKIKRDNKTENLKKALQNFYDRTDNWMNELDSLYDEYNTHLKDIESNIAKQNEILKEYTDNQLSVEEMLMNAITDREQAIIDKMQDLLDATQEAAEQYINGLSDALNKEKKLYDDNKNDLETAKLQRQLAILERSGGSTSEIKSLRNQLDSRMQDEYFNGIQDQIDKIQEASDIQIEKMQKQIDIATEQLEYSKENGLYWEEVTTMMTTWGVPEMMDFIETNTEDFLSKSLLQQQETSKEQQKALEMWMGGNLWGNIKSEFEKLYSQEVINKYADAAKEAFIAAGGGAQGKEAANAIISGGAERDAAAIATRDKMRENAERDFEDYWNSIIDKYDANKAKDVKEKARDEYINSYAEDGKDKSEKAVIDLLENNAKKQSGLGVVSVSKGDYFIRTGPGTSYKDIGVAKKGSTLEWAGETSGSWAKVKFEGKTGWIKVSKAGTLTKYKNGGLADFTGPAWMDGSKTKPEGILDADTTAFLRDKVFSNSSNSLMNGIKSILALTKDSDKLVNGGGDAIDNSVNIENIDINVSSNGDARQIGQDVMAEILRVAKTSTNIGVSRR